MIQQLKYVWPARLAGLAVIRAATALGWIDYAYNVADHMHDADSGFELLAELEYQQSATSLLRRIVDSDAAMMRENQRGSQQAYQRAADHFYDTLEEAEDFLMRQGR
jgi:hypothetical protein